MSRIRRKIGFYLTPQKGALYGGPPKKQFFPKFFFTIQKTHKLVPLLQVFRDIVKIAWEKSLLENFTKNVGLYGGYQKTNFPGYDLYTIF